MYLYLLALVVLSWVLLRLRRRAEPVEARSEDPVKSPPAEDPDAQLVATKSVPELTKLAAADDGLAAGGAVTIDALSAALRGGLDVAWNAAAAHLDRVANTQVAARHANAHAYVNAGLSVRVASGVVASARLFFGGVAPRTKLFRATAAEAALAGKPVADADAFQAAVAALRAQLPTDDAYATDCAVQLLYKACLLAQPSLPPRVANALRSLAAHRPPSSGARDVAGASDGRYAPACAPRVKLAARLQASGEALRADEPGPATRSPWPLLSRNGPGR
ncbi:xanthine dehydrogenase [Aureococcus anophagefferens]|nr:xanthine dehydrogenase [Aureococcus anophagefferens]